MQAAPSHLSWLLPPAAAGDAEAYRAALAGYELAQEFVKTVGPQFGWPALLEEIDEETRGLVQEAFAADPSWASKVQCGPGGPLAGRAAGANPRLVAQSCRTPSSTVTHALKHQLRVPWLQGSILVEAPAPLRAGRIVIELWDKEVGWPCTGYCCRCCYFGG